MAHDVFISYAHQDKPTGDAVCATLEGRGIQCWMAPRDVLSGVIASAAIVEAIHASRVFVLVFSAEADASPHVLRELEQAVHSGIAVLPLRIEDVPLSPSMESFIRTSHWLDALAPPLEEHLAHLADTVKLLLQKADAEAEAARAGAASPSAAPPIRPTPPTPAPIAAATIATRWAPVPVRTRAHLIPRGAGGVSVRAMAKWALVLAAGLVLVLGAGLMIASSPGGGTGPAPATPPSSAPSGTPAAAPTQGMVAA